MEDGFDQEGAAEALRFGIERDRQWREEELRRRVALMRELGVEEWAGIVLGPPPRAASTAAPPPATKEEAERARKEARLAEARQAVADKLDLGSWEGLTETERKQVDAYLPPEMFE